MSRISCGIVRGSSSMKMDQLPHPEPALAVDLSHPRRTTFATVETGRLTAERDNYVAAGSRVSVRTPSGVPSSSTSAPRLAKRPFATTPAIWLSVLSSAAGSITRR